MVSAFNLPDLDTLDQASLKAMILAQHDHYQAQHERYTRTLNSRAGEIERLVLLVAKLNQMLFGRKSEKVLRQIEQLEFQLEDLPGGKRCRRGSGGNSRRAARSGEASPPALAGASSTRSSHPYAGSRGLPRLRRPAP